MRNINIKNHDKYTIAIVFTERERKALVDLGLTSQNTRMDALEKAGVPRTASIELATILGGMYYACRAVGDASLPRDTVDKFLRGYELE